MTSHFAAFSALHTDGPLCGPYPIFSKSPKLPKLISLFVFHGNWVNSPNSGCLINIENGPQSGPPLYSMTKGHEVAHQFIIGSKAARRPISL